MSKNWFEDMVDAERESRHGQVNYIPKPGAAVLVEPPTQRRPLPNPADAPMGAWRRVILVAVLAAVAVCVVQWAKGY